MGIKNSRLRICVCNINVSEYSNLAPLIQCLYPNVIKMGVTWKSTLTS